MNEFKPYSPEECFNVLLTKSEALLIQKIRKLGYGQITAHVVADKIVRTETVSSELMKDRLVSESVTIAFVKREGI